MRNVLGRNDRGADTKALAAMMAHAANMIARAFIDVIAFGVQCLARNEGCYGNARTDERVRLSRGYRIIKFCAVDGSETRKITFF